MEKVLKTTDYDQFQFYDFNRPLNENHVMRLKDSIETNNKLFANPILVDQDSFVIDGQHRLTAAKMLKTPIYYRKVSGVDQEDISTFNNINLRWKMEDFLHYHAERGNINYVKLRNLYNKVGLKITILLGLVLGRSITEFNIFKSGKFIFKDEFSRYPYEIYFETIEYIKRFRGDIKQFRSKRFARALFILASDPEFNTKRWFKNVTRLVNRFHPCVSEKEYLEMFEEIYNFGKKSSR